MQKNIIHIHNDSFVAGPAHQHASTASSAVRLPTRSADRCVLTTLRTWVHSATYWYSSIPLLNAATEALATSTAPQFVHTHYCAV